VQDYNIINNALSDGIANNTPAAAEMSQSRDTGGRGGGIL